MLTYTDEVLTSVREKIFGLDGVTVEHDYTDMLSYDINGALETVGKDGDSMIKVLSLVNEALLRLGKKDDTASATGSLHAKIAKLYNLALDLTYKAASASDVLQISSDSEAGVASQTSYRKEKRNRNIPIRHDSHENDYLSSVRP